jgi:hypothetical protein
MGARDIDLGQELLNSVAALAAEVAVELLKLEEAQAAMLGEEMAVRYSERWGGRPAPYIAMGRVFQARRTEDRVMACIQQMRDAKEPQPYKAASEVLKISLTHVYRVEKRVIEAERAKRQGKLVLE